MSLAKYLPIGLERVLRPVRRFFWRLVRAVSGGRGTGGIRQWSKLTPYGMRLFGEATLPRHRVSVAIV
jgi:hypothetical protein